MLFEKKERVAKTNFFVHLGFLHVSCHILCYHQQVASCLCFSGKCVGAHCH